MADPDTQAAMEAGHWFCCHVNMGTCHGARLLHERHVRQLALAVPIDPRDVEQLPPVDIDRCDHCAGTGAVWDGRDPQTADACPVCGGEGILPEYLGGAA